jgi:hypothetical protein
MSAVENGLEVIDLQDNAAFARRRLRVRHLSAPIAGVNRLARVLVEAPGTILQELVQTALELCGADSAGISLELINGTDAVAYEWAATAGEYSKFLHAMLPRTPSACGLCLERGKPQLFRVSKQFFDLLGVKAAAVTDGILLPWQVHERRGTVWILAHGRSEAFDQDDCRILRILADLAAMGVRQQGYGRISGQATALSRGAEASTLAKKFDNSLQTMKNTLYMAEWSQKSTESQMVADEMTDHLEELSSLMRRLMQLPEANSRPN